MGVRISGYQLHHIGIIIVALPYQKQRYFSLLFHMQDTMIQWSPHQNPLMGRFPRHHPNRKMDIYLDLLLQCFGP